jgi:phage repressor protein C with HTH and peptisase S24 domain
MQQGNLHFFVAGETVALAMTAKRQTALAQIAVDEEAEGDAPAQGSLAERLRAARKERGLSLQKLASKVGLKYQTLQGLESGLSQGSKHIVKIAKALDVSPDWLLSGYGRGPFDAGHQIAKLAEASMQKGGNTVVDIVGKTYASIGQFDVAFSAGPGSLIENDPEPMGYQLFEVQWLRKFSITPPDQLVVVRVSGDSMKPTLEDGDWVLVDLAQRRISREGIYALRVFDDAWVKRISLNIGNKTVRIISDNVAIPMQEIGEGDLNILGRVVAIVARKVP